MKTKKSKTETRQEETKNIKVKSETKTETAKFNLKPMKLKVLKLHIIGKSPYLPEPMDMAMLDRYDKKKSNQTYEKDTESEEDKLKKKCYYTTDGKVGIPARGFYNAMVQASSYLFDRQDGGKRIVREGVIVRGMILPLKFKSKEVVTHWGRSSGMTKAPRKILRNQFNEWETDLEIEFNESQLSPDNIVHILNYAGFYIGIGSFRKEKSGNYGMFEVKI